MSFQYELDCKWLVDNVAKVSYTVMCGSCFEDVIDGIFDTVDMEHYRVTMPNVDGRTAMTVIRDNVIEYRTGATPVQFHAGIYARNEVTGSRIYLGSLWVAIPGGSLLSKAIFPAADNV